MLQSFLLSFCFVVCSSRQMPCCPGLLWGAAHVKRLEELMTRQILVPSYSIFLSRFFCFSILVQCLIVQGFLWQEQTSIIASLTVLSYGTSPSRAVPSEHLEELLIRQILVPSYGIFHSNLLHPERLLDGALCFFHWQIFVTDQRSAQVVSPVNRWPLQRQEKNYLLLAGIECGLPSCKSDVLPLDHGLPLRLNLSIKKKHLIENYFKK